MPTGILTRPPGMAVATINEVLSIADALERAAVARYSALGACMRRVGHDDVAHVFESLAAEEQSHVEGVRRLSQAVLSAPPSAEITRWVLPEAFSAEDAGPPTLLTPYKALSIAVRGEERAFAFWAYVASNAANEQVRDQAEQMARQELVHAAKLRHARRRAFHAERSQRRGELERRSATDLFAVRHAVAQFGAEAAEFLSVAARRLDQLADSENAELLRTIAAEIRRSSNMASGLQSGGATKVITQRIEWSVTIGRTGVLFEAAGTLERLAERYLDMLEHSADALATEELQTLIDQTTRQTARLNARLYEAEPSLAVIAADTPTHRSGAGHT